MDKNVIVTGGLGYIGSHTCIELVAAGYNPIIIDDLSNCKQSVHKRIQTITQNDKIPFVKGNISDTPLLEEIFEKYKPIAVMHFAGSKAVGESVREPLWYYKNNVETTLNLLNVMNKFNVKTFVFSSSATVYSSDNEPPFTEDMDTGGASNPYGKTKYMVEEILKDLQTADDEWSVILLRYFNPVGADPSGMIGEDPNGIPNNLMPFISKVAIGELPELKIFGDDYPTEDGTGVRDYIHVTDLARGHVAALEKKGGEAGTYIYNLGSGKGSSVLEVMNAYAKACGKDIPHSFAPRRDGDLATSYADAQKAAQELQWKSQRTLDDMAVDSWRWISNAYLSDKSK